MEKKRKVPARSARAENANKRRWTPDKTSTSTGSPVPPPTVVDDAPAKLPRKVENGKELPTVEEPQSSDLPSRDFQSIEESAVLVESLHRSRLKWLSDGIFERYWTKPIKKKGQTEQPAKNPGKDTMTKLGHVTIIVEPHSFEATMYAIKDNTPRPPLPQTQHPMYRPIIQYGPPGGTMPLPAPTQALVQPAPTPKTEDTHMSNSGMTPPPPSATHTPTIHTNGVVPNGPSSSQGLHPPPAVVNPPPPPPTAAPGRGADPVIQMLAARAATDPDLKALMRIVANGGASRAQLESFQNHIDDLTRLQQARQAAAEAAQQAPRPENPPTPSSAALPSIQTNGVTTPNSFQTPPAPTPPKAAPVTKNSGSPAPSAKADYQQPQALRSKGPPPPSKSDISGIVFEFNSGNGDRYLFPKFSILETIPGNQVVVSFLIVRKGSTSDSSSYDRDLDYYQPMTIRIQAQQARQLDSLHKVVASQEEVHRYMDDVMDKATRAEYVLLAMRLPKDPDQVRPVEKEEEEKVEEMAPIVGWATTNNPEASTTIKVKPLKKVLSEEEQYNTFITSVTAPV